MSIWAIADLHLAFSVPEKHMNVFGPEWDHYTDKIETLWRQKIDNNDLVLIPGDISWAMHPKEAQIDLEWIGRLPGTKVMIKGNHDLWWSSLSKVKQILPNSCYVIQNDSFNWNDVSIAGTRLWDTKEYHFDAYINYKENTRANKDKPPEDPIESEKIFQRELNRLEISLQSMNPQARLKIAMTHYPPIGATLQDSAASNLLEKYKISICVFGHLHNVKRDMRMFGKHHDIDYRLVACDYLDFNPVCLYASN